MSDARLRVYRNFLVAGCVRASGCWGKKKKKKKREKRNFQRRVERASVCQPCFAICEGSFAFPFVSSRARRRLREPTRIDASVRLMDPNLTNTGDTPFSPRRRRGNSRVTSDRRAQRNTGLSFVFHPHRGRVSSTLGKRISRITLSGGFSSWLPSSKRIARLPLLPLRTTFSRIPRCFT